MGELWAITSYFNPVPYRRRLVNYRLFRRCLSVPLVTVELGFGRGFELGEEDADVLVQIQGGDVMWQKERLLNIALSHLPAGCDTVAWLDCDMVFESEDWAKRAKHGLDESMLVHLFQERLDLDEDGKPDRYGTSGGTLRNSLIHKMAMGQARPEDLFLSDAPLKLRSTVGLGWATRKDVAQKHGLYDAAILGSGDRLIVCAALGKFDYGLEAVAMSAHQAKHYLCWAQPFHETIRGRVGSIPGRVWHLWHGELAGRAYAERYLPMKGFDFDPSRDIAEDADGSWRWSSAKPQLHAYVRQYFQSRREDGSGG